MSDLTKFYDELKTELNRENEPGNIMKTGTDTSLQNSLGALAWRNQAAKESENLQNSCAKHILLDIYCKILPLDSGFIHGHQGMMKSDIDNFLTHKDMSPTQYLTSGYEKTRAPLLEYVLRSCKNIGKQFMEEAQETLKEAQEKKMDVQPPVSDVDNKETQDQLVDIKDDTEYSNFIDQLKEKTIKKIVTDVSKIITDKKQEKDMAFELKDDASMESAVSVVVDYVHQKLWKENVELNNEDSENIIGMAIREATLNILDYTFKQPGSDVRSFSNKVRLGKGFVVNESAITYFKENMSA